MPWILLLVAVVCFGLTFSTKIPFIMTVILLMMALGFLFAAVLSFLSARLQSSRRDDSKMISAEELRLLREQAAARKAAETSKPDNHTAAQE